MELSKFRPRDIGKLYQLKHRLKHGRTINYNWQSRVRWNRAKDGINRQFIIRTFQCLHYRACHAPEPVRLRWRSAYQLFEKRYFASAGQASMRYLNTRTAHAWL
jgi:hypothetical protein